jgi:hypothetical protein
MAPMVPEPPPQLIAGKRKRQSVKAIGTRRRRLSRTANGTAISPTVPRRITPADTRSRSLADKFLAVPPEAVVEIVTVMGTLVVDAVKVRFAGEKLQLLLGGKYKQFADDRVTDPVRPFCGAKVSRVDPDWPGLAMSIVVGFAEIVKASPTPIRIACEVEGP